jgi:hypothetical protein
MASMTDSIPSQDDAAATASGGGASTQSLTRAERAAINRLKPPVLKALTPQHRLMISYMVHGCEHDWISRWVRKCPTEDDPDAERPLRPGEPLRIEEAARILGIRLKQARDLFKQAVFQRAYNAEIKALRDGAKLGAMRTAIELLEHSGEGKAADAKVRLDAAKFILGEESAGGSSVNVSVGMMGGGSQPLRAGVVIRLKSGKAPVAPIEHQAAAEDEFDGPTIDLAPVVSRDEPFDE